MSDSRRFDLRDPKHGLVGDLCRKLGYASDRKGTPRSTHFLSSKVAKFRKKFVETTTRIDLFPLEYQSTDAQLCASSFLAENLHLFKDSEEARAFSWPTTPEKDEKLIENLAKLMCTQEYVYRRNVNYAESMREKRVREENEDSALDESDSEASEPVERPSSPASSIHSSQEDQDANTREKVRENIKIHLDFMYPLDGSEEGTRSRFLFDDSGKWPRDAKRFTFRYIHERNLYYSRKTNPGAIIQFAADLKRHLHVECTEAGDLLARRRCGRQITYRAGVWRGYGFLRDTNGVLKKTAQFEAEWRDRRQRWIDLVHNGDPTGVIELETTPPNASDKGAGGNRNRIPTEPAHGLPPRNTPTGSAAKRPRLNGFERTPSDSINGSDVDHGSEVGHGRREAMSVEADMIREPRRAPERPMSGPEGARPQSRARVLRGGPEQNDGSTLQSSASAENSSNMDQTLSSLQPNDSSACSTPALNERLYMPPSLEKRSSPYALLGSSLNLPFNADTALVKSARMAPPGKGPEKQILHYILPSSKGGLDHKNALPREAWWGCNLSEFFNVVASRAGRPEGSFSCLTLTYNWAVTESFVVNKFEGDQYWEEIRQRVKAKFLKARNSMKKKIPKFELWVECGDTTNIDEVDEEDDC